MATPPDFTAGQVLTAAQMNAIGLWRVTGLSATFTGGTPGTIADGVVTIGSANTAIAVTNAFNDDFENYKIKITGGASSVTCLLQMRLGATTTNYYQGRIGVTLSAGTAAVGAQNGTGTEWVAVGSSTTSGLYGDINLEAPKLAKFTNLSCSYYDATTTISVVGYQGSTTSFTGFTIFASTGNLTGGTIRVYGYNL